MQTPQEPEIKKEGPLAFRYHFAAKLRETVITDLDAFDISLSDLLAAPRFASRNFSVAPASPCNFSECCAIICELVLPRFSLWATL